jgi:hypothetical protein
LCVYIWLNFVQAPDAFDLVCYAVLLALSVGPLYLACTERLMPTRGSSPWQPLFISAATLLVLLAADLSPPVYHLLSGEVDDDGRRLRMRPLYGAHTVLACYVFLPVPSEAGAVVCGFLATAAHMACLATVSYDTSLQSHDTHFATRVSTTTLRYFD